MKRGPLPDGRGSEGGRLFGRRALFARRANHSEPRPSGSGPLALALLAVAAGLVPVYWLLTISLKTEVDQFAMPPQWIFTPTLEHYRALLNTRSMEQALWNSIIAAVSNRPIA